METSHITFPLLGACTNLHTVSGLRLHLSSNELPTEPGNVVDRVLKVLSAGLEHRLCAAPIPSEFLFGICRALQGSSVMDDSASSIMPLVLSILRPWRILDEKIKYASQGLRALALELAGIRHQGIPHEAASGDINKASTGSPHRSIEGVHVEQTAEANFKPLETTALIRSEDIPWPRLANMSSSNLRHKVKLSLPISLCPINPRPHRQTSSSEYRSGCVACRRPRDSSASPPETPLSPVVEREPTPGTRTGALPVSRASVLSVCPNSNPNKPSTMCSAEVDENIPPLPLRRASTNSGIGLQRSRTPSKASFRFPRPRITSQVRSPSVTTGNKVQLHPNHPRADDIGSHQNKGINWRASGRASSNSCRSRTQNVTQTQIRRAGAFTTSESGPRGRRSLGITAELSDRTNRLSSASDSRCRTSACSDKRCLRHSLQPARRISTIDPKCSHAGVAHH
ncbi:hypothetical protein EDD17DRAFT_1021512 [Pisolithus thermaeus]|nr:hypothetical protein EDD17DRAFT_1021512 [Pisolithus thermaeus]